MVSNGEGFILPFSHRLLAVVAIFRLIILLYRLIFSIYFGVFVHLHALGQRVRTDIASIYAVHIFDRKGEWSISLDIPNSYRTIRTTRNQDISITAEVEGVNEVAMSSHCFQSLSRAEIPKHHCLVFACEYR